MSERIEFKLSKRDLIGKKVRQLRASGVIPGVAYGAGEEPVNIQAEELALEKLITKVGTSTPIDLSINGKKHLAIIKNIDRDVVTNKLYNIEFHLISADETIETEVPIRLVGQGESPAERAGLVVMQVLDTIELSAKPADMIPFLEIDIKVLEKLEDSVVVADLKLPKGVEFADKEIDENLAVVNVYDPAELEAANEAVGGDATDESEVEAEKGGDVEGDEATAEEGDEETKADTPEEAEDKKE
ncbi:MAG: 50S ribosomal protein L25 [Candidatus Nanosyncoccaceae bacterium]|jgi:large subunit ribosomal protein L25